MGLTLLHAADLHLDSPFASFLPDQREMLRRAQQQIPEKILNQCNAQSAQILLLAGDVFDSAYRRETARTLADCLEDCGIPVFITPGNHDFWSLESLWEREMWPDNVYIFRGNLQYVDLPELSCRVYGGGYRSMDCPGLLENFRAERELSHTIGVLHGDALTPRSPYCPVTAAQVGESGLDYLALGHVHQAGSFQSGRTLCAWPGCPMGRGWDETGTKGILKVELGEKPRLTPLQMGLPRFFAQSVDIENLEQTLSSVLPAVAGEDFYRITLTGRGQVDIPALQERFGALGYLEFRDRTQMPEDPWLQAGEDSFRGIFFDLLRQQSEDQAEVVSLAAQISQKLLDGEEVVLP